MNIIVNSSIRVRSIVSKWPPTPKNIWTTTKWLDIRMAVASAGHSTKITDIQTIDFYSLDVENEFHFAKKNQFIQRYEHETQNVHNTRLQ